MGHALRLFVGPLIALRAFGQASAHAHIFALQQGAELCVVPLGDDLQDDLHRICGTGDWLETGPRISTGDMVFAARASQVAALGYVETEYFGGVGEQSAVLWRNGLLALGPTTMTTDSRTAGRPRSLWPINAVLRELGVTAGTHHDEFDAFGLDAYRSNEQIVARATRVDV